MYHITANSRGICLYMQFVFLDFTVQSQEKSLPFGRVSEMLLLDLINVRVCNIAKI